MKQLKQNSHHIEHCALETRTRMFDSAMNRISWMERMNEEISILNEAKFAIRNPQLTMNNGNRKNHRSLVNTLIK